MGKFIELSMTGTGDSVVVITDLIVYVSRNRTTNSANINLVPTNNVSHNQC